eukprot:351948-Chlamydomonas_euryale.AAC.1
MERHLCADSCEAGGREEGPGHGAAPVCGQLRGGREGGRPGKWSGTCGAVLRVWSIEAYLKGAGQRPLSWYNTCACMVPTKWLLCSYLTGTGAGRGGAYLREILELCGHTLDAAQDMASICSHAHARYACVHVQCACGHTLPMRLQSCPCACGHVHANAVMSMRMRSCTCACGHVHAHEVTPVSMPSCPCACGYVIRQASISMHKRRWRLKAIGAACNVWRGKGVATDQPTDTCMHGTQQAEAGRAQRSRRHCQQGVGCQQGALGPSSWHWKQAASTGGMVLAPWAKQIGPIR